MSDKQTVRRTFAASSLRQQESCVACFEQLACVFASCSAEIDLHSNLSNRRADWYGLQASRRPYASPAPVTPNNNAPFISLKINHLQILRAPQKRHAHCVFYCVTTTYVAQSGTACGDGQPHAPARRCRQSSQRLSSRRPVPNNSTYVHLPKGLTARPSQTH